VRGTAEVSRLLAVGSIVLYSHKISLLPDIYIAPRDLASGLRFALRRIVPSYRSKVPTSLAVASTLPLMALLNEARFVFTGRFRFSTLKA
jgi:hypothetical protein